MFCNPPTLSLPHKGGGDAAARAHSSSRVGAAGDRLIPDRGDRSLRLGLCWRPAAAARMCLAAPPDRMSYWQQEGGAASGLPHADPPDECDFAIIGGGLAGLATANAILERRGGASVVVLE